MNALTQQERRPETTEARPRRYVSPPVNIFEEKEGYVLEAEMPGVTKDGLEITLEGNEITIFGRRGEEALPGEAIYRESRPVDYRRSFELDPTIDTGKISAQMDQGVLTLRLPKLEKVKPRKISIGE
jgi:HSP20 family protein